ncbi:MAG TPA: hypothetical protein VLJ16_04265, partial [Acidobacteriota bacterium]|nr:hypothetical protein [Acidobacteriota bacterium]
WYWWRINAWSEIAALSASAATAVFLKAFPGNGLVRGLGAALEGAGFQVDAWGVGILFTVIVTTAVWLAVTFLTKPDEPGKLLAFYRKVRPGGLWGPIAKLNGRAYVLQAAPFAGWVLAVLMIMFLLLGLGKVVFMEWAAGAAYLAAGAVAAVLLSKVIAKIDWEGRG